MSPGGEREAFIGGIGHFAYSLASLWIAPEQTAMNLTRHYLGQASR